MTSLLPIAESTTLRHLGPLDGSRLIVVVGRNNQARQSSVIENILYDLHAEGHSVCWFDERPFSVLDLLNKEFTQLMGGRISRLCARLKRYEKILRQLMKFILLTRHPTLWVILWREVNDRRLFLVNSLDRFLCDLKSPQLYLLGHSAGGIVSSLIPNSNKVKKIACFGYPFKHPEHPDEPYRTKHLEEFAKPFLIFQGDNDAYGSAETSRQYKLSSNICVVSVRASHDYEDFSVDEYERCLTQLRAFFTN